MAFRSVTLFPSSLIIINISSPKFEFNGQNGEQGLQILTGELNNSSILIQTSYIFLESNFELKELHIMPFPSRANHKLYPYTTVQVLIPSFSPKMSTSTFSSNI